MIGTFEYKMSEEMAKNYLKENKGKKNVQEYLCNIVNTQFGIKGTCVRILFF